MQQHVWIWSLNDDSLQFRGEMHAQICCERVFVDDIDS